MAPNSMQALCWTLFVLGVTYCISLPGMVWCTLCCWMRRGVSVGRHSGTQLATLQDEVSSLFFCVDVYQVHDVEVIVYFCSCNILLGFQ